MLSSLKRVAFGVEVRVREDVEVEALKFAFTVEPDFGVTKADLRGGGGGGCTRRVQAGCGCCCGGK